MVSRRETFKTAEKNKRIIAGNAEKLLQTSGYVSVKNQNSIDTWEKRSGANGYFDFIESYMGSQIKGTAMDFTIMS